MHNGDDRERQLVELVTSTAWLMDALHLARNVMFAPWYIGAGAVRSLVWDELHGFAASSRADVDLVFYDLESPVGNDAALIKRLEREMPSLKWDVVNQAHAHTLTGVARAPRFESLEHAIGCWPETATAVGLRLTAAGDLQVVAPFGLDDLFELVLRPSPMLRNPEAFNERLSTKAFLTRWPRLRVERA